MNILGTSQNYNDRDFNFFSSIKMTLSLLFDGYVPFFFLKKKDKRKKIY